MAYRFDGTDDKVEFGIGTFNGYTMGPFTTACFVKRNGGIGSSRSMISITSSGGSGKFYDFIDSSSNHQIQLLNNATDASKVLNSTSLWYLIATTRSTGACRVHLHDGTSWYHATLAGPFNDGSAFGATDRLFIGSIANATYMDGDIVCAGMKKADSSDAAIETLSRTSFQAWRDFGFHWLIGFDSSLETGGILQDQGSVGTSDEIAITGTTAVADPSRVGVGVGATPSGLFTKVIFGDGLTVTDEGAGVIRVDVD